MNRKNYDLVDVSKFVLAILVVAIHSGGVPVAGWLGRVAVPYFFIVSGYFYFKKYNALDTRKERVESYIRYSKRIIYLLVMWEVLYLPLIIYRLTSSENFSIGKTAIQFLIGRLPAFYVAWYLCASVVGLGTLLILINCIGKRATLFVAVFVEVLLIMLSGYHGLSATLGGIFVMPVANNLLYIFARSWLYLMLGRYLSLHVHSINFDVKKCIYFFTSLVIMEQYVIGKFNFWAGGNGTDETIFIPVLAYLLAIFTLKSNVKISGASTLRKLSTFVYLSHPAVLFFKKFGGEYFQFLKINEFCWVLTVIIVVSVYYIVSRNESLIRQLV